MNLQQLAVPVVSIASLFGVACTAEVHTVPPPRAEVVVAAPTIAVAPPRAEVVVAAPPVAVVEAAPAEVVVRTKPPVERVEVIGVAPSANHVWIKGHWHWNGVEWIWNPGRYEIRRVGLQWYPAQYVERGGAMYYVSGHWGR